MWAVCSGAFVYFFVLAPYNRPFELSDNSPRWYWGMLLAVPLVSLLLFLAVAVVVGYSVTKVARLRFPWWANCVCGGCILGVALLASRDPYLRSDIPVYIYIAVFCASVTYTIAWSIQYQRSRQHSVAR